MDDDFLAELRVEFLAEAASLLELWEESFLALEETEDKTEGISNIFRVAHSLKGGSSAVGLPELAGFAHEVEDLLSLIKKDPSLLDSETITLLLSCGDAFKVKVRFLTTNQSPDWEIQELDEKIKVRLAQLSDEKPVKVEAEEEQWKKMLDQMNSGLGTEISPEHLALSDEEILSIADKQIQKKNAPSAVVVPQGSAVSTIKVDASKIDKIMNLIGELVINKSQLANRIDRYHDDALLGSTFSLLEKTIRELQDETLGIRMISLKNLFMKCQRAVRDVALKLGKDIDFAQSGEDVEIDRSMVELITDPLLHMLRNAADHGIESDDERRSSGKAKGRITLNAEQVGSKIIIKIQDDGKGIDPERIFAKAKKLGLVPAASQMNDFQASEILQLILKPGFSTAEAITDISGRGVGLDVVKTSIDKMGGKMEISSVKGQGTNFKLLLPLTTSILEGIHVRSMSKSYIFPTEKVDEILSGDQLDFVEDPDKTTMFKYRGKVIPYLALDTGLSIIPDNRHCKMVLIIEVEGNHLGLGVDEFVTQVHVVLKPINDIVKTSKGVSASCILSHGGIGLVIDSDEIFKSMLKTVFQKKKVA